MNETLHETRRDRLAPVPDVAAAQDQAASPIDPVGAAPRLSRPTPPGEVKMESADTLARATPAMAEAALLRARYPIWLDGRLKTIRFQRVDGCLRLGLNPSWSEFHDNIPIITQIMNVRGRVQKPELDRFKLALKAVKAAEKAYDEAIEGAEEYRRDSDASRKKQKVSETKSAVTELRHANTALEAAVLTFIRFMQDNFADLIEQHDDDANLLGLSGRIRPAAAGAQAQAHVYATGAANDPIPIVWYKAPTDYPAITPRAKNGQTFNVARFGAFHIHTTEAPDPPSKPGRKVLKVKRKAQQQKPKVYYASAMGGRHADDVAAPVAFGVDPANQPSTTGTFALKKVQHDSDRGNQRGYNDLFTGVGVTMGVTTDLDGDHVKDLGFNGQDEADNYWPLNSTINRRAFNGYNGNYRVHFATTNLYGQRVIQQQSIGAMYQKHFKPKAYLGPTDGAVPAESGTAAAGAP